MGGFTRGGGGARGSSRRCSPLGILGVMRFIDHFNGPTQTIGTLVFKNTCTLMGCDVQPFKFEGGPARKSVQSPLSPQLLGFWVVKYH